jgi:nitrite reductase (NO-forming)
MSRALPSRFAATVRYYAAAACFLPVGASLGMLLARGLSDARQEQVALAHAAINVLGWMGLTIVGTLVTLWPTMLRTRIEEGSERAAVRAFPVLLGSIVVAAVGALVGLQLIVALGIVGYLAGLAIVAVPFVSTARGKAPSSYPTRSLLAGLVSLVGLLAVLAVGVATAASWQVAGGRRPARLARPLSSPSASARRCCSAPRPTWFRSHSAVARPRSGRPRTRSAVAARCASPW